MEKKTAHPVIIGVTGSFATGKTTVAAMFKRLGAKVLDADKITHRLIKKDTAAYKEILKEFGGGILDGSGAIDRAKLAAAVFRDKRPLNKLCGIVHPAVISDMKRSIRDIAENGRAVAVVIDAPLLIEAGMRRMVDVLIVVTTSRKTQLERAKKKTGMDIVEIKMRIRNQLPLNKKAKMADYVIDNEGTESSVKKTVKKIWEEIESGRE